MSREQGVHRRNILGVLIDDCDEEQAVGMIADFLAEQPPRMHHVCTVNPEFVMEARSNSAFRQVLRAADVCTPDGVGIILAGRLLGRPFKGRATGVALVNRLAELSAEKGWTLYLLGAAPGVAEEAAAVLQARHPGVRIVGTYAGSPSDEGWPEISYKLKAAQPDILLVAYGAPKQDIWISSHRDDLPKSVKVAMGVGGVFDYLSGRVQLAPVPVRKVGLEWLFRLVMQPWRWRRILRVFRFALLVVARKISMMLRPERRSR